MCDWYLWALRPASRPDWLVLGLAGMALCGLLAQCDALSDGFLRVPMTVVPPSDAPKPRKLNKHGEPFADHQRPDCPWCQYDLPHATHQKFVEAELEGWRFRIALPGKAEVLRFIPH